jgi:hypothetical protein
MEVQAQLVPHFLCTFMARPVCVMQDVDEERRVT